MIVVSSTECILAPVTLFHVIPSDFRTPAVPRKPAAGAGKWRAVVLMRASSETMCFQCHTQELTSRVEGSPCTRSRGTAVRAAAPRWSGDARAVLRWSWIAAIRSSAAGSRASAQRAAVQSSAVVSEGERGCGSSGASDSFTGRFDLSNESA